MLTTQHDSAWLDLVADLVAQPLTEWPAEEVVEVLAGTFGAPAGSYYGQEGDAIEQRAWPEDFPGADRAEIERWTIEHAPREHPLLRWYLASGDPLAMQVADVPTTVASVGLQDQWRSLCDDYLGGLSSQMALPLCLGPTANRTFIVGREDDYTPREVALARRLQRLLTGLDRQIACYGRWVDRMGPCAIEAASAGGLTPRESSVLALLASGHTARAIARRLQVGERTVQKHLQRIYRKLGAGDRLVAVQRAQLIGLLPAPPPT